MSAASTSLPPRTFSLITPSETRPSGCAPAAAVTRGTTSHPQNSPLARCRAQGTWSPRSQVFVRPAQPGRPCPPRAPAPAAGLRSASLLARLAAFLIAVAPEGSARTQSSVGTATRASITSPSKSHCRLCAMRSKNHGFCFHQVFGPKETQTDVFVALGQPLVEVSSSTRASSKQAQEQQGPALLKASTRWLLADHASRYCCSLSVAPADRSWLGPPVAAPPLAACPRPLRNVPSAAAHHHVVSPHAALRLSSPWASARCPRAPSCPQAAFQTG